MSIIIIIITKLSYRATGIMDGIVKLRRDNTNYRNRVTIKY